MTVVEESKNQMRLWEQQPFKHLLKVFVRLLRE